MTVPVQTPTNVYVANGSTTFFPYTFKVLLASDLIVYVNGIAKTLTVDYTVAGAGAAGGGNITFLVAPANLATIIISRRGS